MAASYPDGQDQTSNRAVPEGGFHLMQPPRLVLPAWTMLYLGPVLVPSTLLNSSW